MLFTARRWFRITKTQLKNLTASLLDEVCHDVCVESQLLQLTDENLNEKMAIRSDEARVDIASRSFWVTVQLVFFDGGYLPQSLNAMFTWTLQKHINSTKKKKRRIPTNVYVSRTR